MPLKFVGSSSQYVYLPSASVVKNVAGATIAAWVYIDSFPTGLNKYNVFSRSRGIDIIYERVELQIYSSAGLLRAAGAPNDGDNVQNFTEAVSSLSINTWLHVAATFDFINRIIRLYTNGVLVATSATIVLWTAGNSSNTNSLRGSIGSELGNAEYMNGKIDDCRLYNLMLGDGEIQNIYGCRGSDSIVKGLEQRFLLNEG